MKPEPIFEKVVVVGVGQIGGSLAWAIRRRGLARRIVGVSKKSHLEARRIGAIDQGYFPDELDEAVRGADLIVLALPVRLNEAFVKDASSLASLGVKTRVIDVGSTKARICGLAANGILRKRFTGCHPMAGSERSGAMAANAELFRGAVCFMTRRDPLIQKLWEGIGAYPFLIDPKTHDSWVAYASHMPHVLAFLLFAGFPRPVGVGKNFRPNPSLQDLSRIARSSPGLWLDIFDSNRAELLKASKGFQKLLSRFNQALRKRDRGAMARILREAGHRSQSIFPAAES